MMQQQDNNITIVNTKVIKNNDTKKEVMTEINNFMKKWVQYWEDQQSNISYNV